jgi:UDP-GlcNAc:undecaprenyl-phosphate GlcNAc-1-phosphate transferase
MEIYFIVIICLFFNLLILFNFDKITKFLKFFDNPDGKLKKHKNPISLLGGLIILLNFYLVIFTFKALNFDDLIFNGQFFYIVVVLNTLFYIIGVADDINNLSPKIKLLFITLSFLTVVNFFPDIKLELIKISFLDKIYYFNSYSVPFLLLSFLLLSNAVNMFDGINLQLIFFSIFIFIIFILKGFLPIFFITLLICLFILGFLNYKNKVFLGDGGSYLLSSIIGCTFIYQYKYIDNYLYGDEIFIILLIPSIDMFRLFVVRSINKKNPFKGDLNHFHHIVNNYFKNNNYTVALTTMIFVMPTLLLILNLDTYYILLISVIVYASLISYFKKII